MAEPSKPARWSLPQAPPRDVVEHVARCDGAGACVTCGGMLRKLGEDVTDLLDDMPGSFHAIRHVRPKLSCRGCDHHPGAVAQLWWGQSTRLLRPLVDALGRHVMAGGRMHADDTVVPVLEPGLNRIRMARFWVTCVPIAICRSDPAPVFYRYTRSARASIRRQTGASSGH